MRISASSPELQGLLGYDPEQANQPSGVRETVRGTNANLTINGMAVTSASNTVADAAQGVTLTLNKVGTTSLSVTRDLDNVKSAVQAFVSAFNNLHNMAGKLTAVDSTTKTGSVLTGDGVLRGIQTKLRNILNASAGSAAGGISNPAQIGLVPEGRLARHRRHQAEQGAQGQCQRRHAPVRRRGQGRWLCQADQHGDRRPSTATRARKLATDGSGQVAEGPAEGLHQDAGQHQCQHGALSRAVRRWTRWCSG